MENSFETAGLSTGFIVILGVAYRVLKNSNFQFSSSCRDRLVQEATYEIKDRVRQAIQEELTKVVTGESKATSPTYGASPPHIDTIPPLPRTPDI